MTKDYKEYCIKHTDHEYFSFKLAFLLSPACTKVYLFSVLDPHAMFIKHPRQGGICN